MEITVEGFSGAKYSFEGPYSGTDSLSDNSGVYLIVRKNGSEYDPIDVGESDTVKTSVGNHNRAECWKEKL